MQEKELKKMIKNRLIFAIFLSAIFIIGIIFLIIGFKKDIQILIILGFIFTLMQIYMLPLIWFNYGAWIFYKKIYYAIVKDEIKTSIEIANHLKKKDKEVTKGINLLFENNLLPEYIFKDQYKIIKK